MKKVLIISESEKERIISLYNENKINEQDFKPETLRPDSTQVNIKNLDLDAIKKFDKKNLELLYNPKNLKKGDKGPEVVKLQKLLIKNGYNTFQNPTGFFGNKTEESLKYALSSTKPSKTKSSQLKQSTTNSDSKKDLLSFGFTNFFRKYFPNITQMFFTRDLSNSDFTKSQKKVLFDVILSAVKRGQSPKKGSTQYEDYSQEIKAQLDTKEGASTLKTVVGSLLPDDKFKMATTLGRFSYQLVDGNKYLVTDNYDFSKGVDYDKINSKELEGKSYTEKLFYVMKKNDWSLYRASRFLAYLEHPQNSPDKEKIKIKVELDPQELAQIEKASNTNNLA